MVQKEKLLHDAERVARMTIHAGGKAEFSGLRDGETPELALKDGRQICFLVTRQAHPTHGGLRAYAGRMEEMREVGVRENDIAEGGMAAKEYHVAHALGVIIRVQPFEALDAFEPRDELILFLSEYEKTDCAFSVLIRPAPVLLDGAEGVGERI